MKKVKYLYTLTAVLAVSCVATPMLMAETQTDETANLPVSTVTGPQEQTGLKSYRNGSPAFEVSVPAACKDWEIRHSTTNEKEKPITLLKANNNNNLPFISTYIDYYDSMDPETKQLWSDADKLFESKISTDKKLEKEILPDVEFISDKKTSLDGLAAFERLYRSEKSGATYHALYVLFPEGLVQFTLSSWTAWFDQDDKDFMAIASTLRRM